MGAKQGYETVVGLEVHARLLTNSKLFCGDSSFFGDEPNTNISPITLAHPGTLPKMNKEAIGFAVKLGLACHSEIEKQNYFARKKDRKSTRLNSSHSQISYAVFCLK